MGLTYEHSPSEGQPVAVLTDHVVKYMWVQNTLPKQKIISEWKLVFRESNNWKNLPDVKTEKYPEPLVFNINKEVTAAMVEATTNVNRFVLDCT